MHRLVIIVLLLQVGFLQAQTVNKIIKIGNSPVTVEVKDYTAKPAFVFFNMHENENTSVNAARPVLEKGGSFRLMVLKHNGRRNLEFSKGNKKYAVDPNRIYTRTGTELTVERNSEKADKYAIRVAYRFSKKLKRKFLNKAKYIVALHNNTPDNYSVLGYLPGGTDAPDVAEIYVNEQQDHDDFFYTTDKQFFDFAKLKGYNSVLQKPGLVRDDGSLSVYCGIKNILYINIEAEHGHTEIQQQMTEVVVEYLNAFFK